MLNKDFKEKFSERINSLKENEKNEIMSRIFNL